MPISFPVSGVVATVCERKKNRYSNETGIFAQSCQSRWIFFLDLELEEAFLYISNLPSGNTTDFTYYLSYTMAKKNVIFYAIMYSLPTSL